MIAHDDVKSKLILLDLTFFQKTYCSIPNEQLDYELEISIVIVSDDAARGNCLGTHYLEIKKIVSSLADQRTAFVIERQ